MKLAIQDTFPVPKNTLIAGLSAVGIAAHLLLRYGANTGESLAQVPLALVLMIGGIPLIYNLIQKIVVGQFGSDFLAGISIVTSVLLQEFLAGSIVVLMLAGGQALESYAVKSASSVLRALANRMPSIAHRKHNSTIVDVNLDDVVVGDVLVIYPHEICPVDGQVSAGQGVMDESYLTGEPFKITKTRGSTVISGAINGDSMLTVVATRRSADSRYAKIMKVMHESEETRPRLRRLADQLGAIYTPVALLMAFMAWGLSGEAVRFLAVLVIATPCPLLIAIPVAIIGSISLAARRGIIVKSPVALEQITKCRTAIFDKTGTLTYGRPKLVSQVTDSKFKEDDVLALVASLERYSKHPLAKAILDAAGEKGVVTLEASLANEPPGRGLEGVVAGHDILITGRRGLSERSNTHKLPPEVGGLECVVFVDGDFAAIMIFRDSPREESRSFVKHLGPKHHFSRILIVSGDRESEVRYLAEEVGITEVHAEASPEEKLEIVQRETRRAKTLYVGDGINDAPAMMAATIGTAIGRNSDVTTEAADVVIMDNSLGKVDEFIHISGRMRSIALQSAVVGMLLSVIGMLFASAGYLNPVGGAICQEVIDVFAVLYALRAAVPPKLMSDV